MGAEWCLSRFERFEAKPLPCLQTRTVLLRNARGLPTPGGATNFGPVDACCRRPVGTFQRRKLPLLKVHSNRNAPTWHLCWRRARELEEDTRLVSVDERIQERQTRRSQTAFGDHDLIAPTMDNVFSASFNEKSVQLAGMNRVIPASMANDRSLQYA